MSSPSLTLPVGQPVGTMVPATLQPSAPALVELLLAPALLHLAFVVSLVYPVGVLAARTTPTLSSHLTPQVQIATLVHTNSASPTQMFANSG